MGTPVLPTTAKATSPRQFDEAVSSVGALLAAWALSPRRCRRPAHLSSSSLAVAAAAAASLLLVALMLHEDVSDGRPQSTRTMFTPRTVVRTMSALVWEEEGGVRLVNSKRTASAGAASA